MLRRSLLAASISLLAGCSASLRLFVINNTGQSIEIRRIATRSGVALRRPMIVSDGQGINTGVSYTAQDDRWDIAIAIAGRCVHYAMPTPGLIAGYPWDRDNLQPHIHVQVEPDLTVHLVPDTARTPVDVREFVARQTSGFPLTPTDQTC